MSFSPLPAAASAVSGNVLPDALLLEPVDNFESPPLPTSIAPGAALATLFVGTTEGTLVSFGLIGGR